MIPCAIHKDRFLLGRPRLSWTDIERARFLREMLRNWREKSTGEGSGRSDGQTSSVLKEAMALEAELESQEAWLFEGFLRS